jgi:GWxTD domain-containing protein
MKRQLSLIGPPFLIFFWVVFLSLMKAIGIDKGENSGTSTSLERRGSDSYWRNWLEQDVAYIITDEERAAFEKLTGDAECLQFIDQFWLRRDPAFTTPENEFKNEHYRRLAYANGQYAVDAPGWSTDRGKIYILLGPPGNIIRADTFSQIWHYDNIPWLSPGKEVALEFVDKLRSHDDRLTDYRLTMDSTVEALLHWFRQEIHLQECCVQLLENRKWLSLISHPPLIRYKDLETVLNSKLNPNLFLFKCQAAFRKLTDATVLTSIGFQVQDRDLTYQQQSDSSMLATVNIFARITDPKGYVWEEFEAQMKSEAPEPFFKEMMEGTSYYQKAVPLRAGLYNLELAVKDLYSGKVGAIYRPLQVPGETDMAQDAAALSATQVVRGGLE